MTDRRDRSDGLRTEAGFSLAEVLMATAISSVVLLALYLLYDINQVTFVKGEQQADLQQNARIAVDRIVRELRLAGFDRQTPTIIPAPCTTAIQSATATSITFIGDVNPNNAPTERVEYRLDPACVPSCAVDPPKIRREEWLSYIGGNCTLNPSWAPGNGAQPFAERVTAVTFAYYDENNGCLGGGPPCGVPPNPVPVGSLGNIRRISIRITTQDAQTGSKAQPFTLRAEVHPRNLGL